MTYFRPKTDTKAPFTSDEKPVKQDKKKPGFIKRTPIKKKFKATGEALMFKEIWDERPHICINCKENLGNEMRTWFFSHIKNKKHYPQLRLDKNNIQLLCLKCHHEYDNGTRESYYKRQK